MGQTLADLANRMDKLAASLTMEASRCAVEAAVAIVEDLAYKTPVDTSAALSNWQGSLEMPNLNEIEPYYPGSKGSTKLRSARGTVETLKLELENKKFGQTIYITNNVEYIRKLNDGSSKQEPAGFVERAVLIGRKSIKRFKLKLRY